MNCRICYSPGFGFEIGSGISGLTVSPADDLILAYDLVTLPSFIEDGGQYA